MVNPILDEARQAYPGVQITLPTQGQFYPEGVLDASVQGGDVQVGVLSMVDEQKYRDPFLLVTGKAVHDMIRRLCPQILHPEELAEIDVEAILLAARMGSYGPSLKITHTCPHVIETVQDGMEPVRHTCDEANTVDIDMHEFIMRYAPFDADSTYEVVLPKVQQTVFLQPVPYKTSVELTKLVVSKNKQIDEMLNQQIDVYVADPSSYERYSEFLNTSSEVALKALVGCIVSVRTRSGTDVFDQGLILEWIKSIPIEDSRFLSEKINGIATTHRELSRVRYQCGSCERENSFHVQMNPELLFLADAEDSKTPRTSSATSEGNKKRSKPRLRG